MMQLLFLQNVEGYAGRGYQQVTVWEKGVGFSFLPLK